MDTRPLGVSCGVGTLVPDPLGPVGSPPGSPPWIWLLPTYPTRLIGLGCGEFVLLREAAAGAGVPWRGGGVCLLFGLQRCLGGRFVSE